MLLRLLTYNEQLTWNLILSISECININHEIKHFIFNDLCTYQNWSRNLSAHSLSELEYRALREMIIKNDIKIVLPSNPLRNCCRGIPRLDLFLTFESSKVSWLYGILSRFSWVYGIFVFLICCWINSAIDPKKQKHSSMEEMTLKQNKRNCCTKSLDRSEE